MMNKKEINNKKKSKLNLNELDNNIRFDLKVFLTAWM